MLEVDADELLDAGVDEAALDAGAAEVVLGAGVAEVELVDWAADRSWARTAARP